MTTTRLTYGRACGIKKRAGRPPTMVCEAASNIKGNYAGIGKQTERRERERGKEKKKERP